MYRHCSLCNGSKQPMCSCALRANVSCMGLEWHYVNDGRLFIFGRTIPLKVWVECLDKILPVETVPAHLILLYSCRYQTHLWLILQAKPLPSHNSYVPHCFTRTSLKQQLSYHIVTQICVFTCYAICGSYTCTVKKSYIRFQKKRLQF